MAINSREVDKLLNDMDITIKKLKIEYDIFFAGGKKTPPENMKMKVEKMIQRLLDEKGMSFAQKFRFNTLVARYNVYKELWRKKLKQIEEGGRERDEKVIEELLSKNLTNYPQREEVNSIVTTSPENQKDEIKDFYKTIVKKHQEVTGKEPSFKFEQFYNFVERKTNEYKKKYKCKGVEFDIKVDGKNVKIVTRKK